MSVKKKLPRGWREATLEQAVEIDAHAVLPQRGSSYTYVGLEHIEGGTGQFLPVNQVDGSSIQSQKFRFGSGHILYGKLRPYLNKVALPDFEGICSTDILPLSPRAGAVREYVAYWLAGPVFLAYATSRSTGTKMPRLNPQALLRALIPLPPPPVQSAIVSILQKADSIRRKRAEARQLADRLLPIIFQQMFGDSETNPMGWPVKSLEAVSDIRSGVTKGRDLHGKSTVQVPYLRVANVQEGYLDLSEIKEIEVLPSDLEKYRLERGDVLLTEGGDPDKLGRGFIWNDEIQGCIHQNHIFRVRVDRRCLLPEYLAFLTRTPYAKRYFLKAAKRSSNLASVNSTQLRALSIPLPPLRLQERFRDAFEAATRRLLSHEPYRTSEAIFSRLLASAFTGDLVA